MSLPGWRDNGWLKDHKPSHQEVAQLLAATNRDLQSAEAVGLAAEWRFSIAYNGILQAATAALAAAGYRASRDLHHHRVLQSLRHTIELDAQTIGFLDGCRRKRHKSLYEAVGTVSDREVQEILDLARTLRDRIGQWIRDHHPELGSTVPPRPGDAP